MSRRSGTLRTDSAREKEMIALAIDEAERRIRDGTASSQIIVHYLRLGTEREKLERAKLQADTVLVKAKADAIEAGREYEERFAKVIDAMRSYQGVTNEQSE